MSRSDRSPHVCYYASVLAQAVQEDNDTFAALHDIVAQRISSSATKIKEIENLAHEYTGLPKHVLLTKIKWLEDRGIKPLRGERIKSAGSETTGQSSENARQCENSQATVQLGGGGLVSYDWPLQYPPKHGSVTDTSKKMEEHKNKLRPFGNQDLEEDGNNNVQANNSLKKKFDVELKNVADGLVSSKCVEDKDSIYTVIDIESLPDFDVSRPVKFDFLQPTPRNSKGVDSAPSGKCSPIEMQEIKKDSNDQSWSWRPGDRSVTKSDEQRDENISAKKKKKKKKAKKPADETVLGNAQAEPDIEAAESKSAPTTKSSRAARRRKLLDALKLKDTEEVKEPELMVLPEDEKKEIKMEQPVKRKRSIKEYKKNKLKEELEKRSGKISPVNELSQLTTVPSSNYGTTNNSCAVMELESLMHSSSKQNSGTEHKRPKKDKKEAKSKSKHKEGKNSIQEQTNCKFELEKGYYNSSTNERNLDCKNQGPPGASPQYANAGDVQWPFLKQNFGSHPGGNGSGKCEVQVPQSSMSYASKVRSSLQLDSAGGSLASSCEDSSSSTSSNGNREYNAGAERSPSPASLPDLESKPIHVERKDTKESSETEKVVQNKETLVLPESSLPVKNVGVCDGVKTETEQASVPEAVHSVTEKPQFADNTENRILPNELEVLLKNDLGLDFFNDRIVNDDVEDHAKESVVDNIGASGLLDFKFDASELPVTDSDEKRSVSDPQTHDIEPEIESRNDDRGARAKKKPAFDYHGALKFIWKEWLSTTQGKN